MERKLASIRVIADVQKIEGADSICAYVIDGWTIVDSINKYKIGDFVIMLEIDSWVPTEIAGFLSKGNQPREYNGIKGERLKTIKLRGCLSQGLILPISILGDVINNEGGEIFVNLFDKYKKDADISNPQ